MGQRDRHEQGKQLRTTGRVLADICHEKRKITVLRRTIDGSTTTVDRLKDLGSFTTYCMRLHSRTLTL